MTPWARGIAGGLPLVLAASLVAVTAPIQQAAVAAPKSSCPASRPDRAAALVTAQLCKGRVAVDDATTGRFLSVDPVPGGSANAYDYVTDNPVNSSDTDGRRAWHIGWATHLFRHKAHLDSINFRALLDRHDPQQTLQD